MGSPVVFIILAAIALASGLGMLLSRNAVHSALYLVLNFCTIAVFYIILNAPFIAMVQITVYAGAIVVLFLFVIMLLGADKLRGATGGIGWQYYGALLLGLALVGSMLAQVAGSSAATVMVGILLVVAAVFVVERLLRVREVEGFAYYGTLAGILVVGLLLIGQMRGEGDGSATSLPPLDASPEAIGLALFESYVFPFEVTSILLLVAMMSLVVWQSQKRKKS